MWPKLATDTSTVDVLDRLIGAAKGVKNHPNNVNSPGTYFHQNSNTVEDL